MTLPSWLFFLVAFWVIAFGVYRLWIAATTRSRPSDEAAGAGRPNFRRRGMFGRSWRAHLALGALYILLGAALAAMGLGWQPSAAIQPAASRDTGAGT